METEATELAKMALANAEKFRIREKANAEGLAVLEIDGEFVATMSREDAETLKSAVKDERLL